MVGMCLPQAWWGAWNDKPTEGSPTRAQQHNSEMESLAVATKRKRIHRKEPREKTVRKRTTKKEEPKERSPERGAKREKERECPNGKRPTRSSPEIGIQRKWP